MKFFLQSSIFVKLMGFIWGLAGVIATVIIGLSYGVVIIVVVVLVFLAIMGIYNLVKGKSEKKKASDTNNLNKDNQVHCA